MQDWYQNIIGVTPTDQHPERRVSKFWGDGKWDTFIEPLIPFKYNTGRTFVELGCNAGLFLLRAGSVGFRRIVGIEALNKFHSQAQTVVAQKGSQYSIKLMHKIVGENTGVHPATGKLLDLNLLPVADMTLLANVHYWINEPALVKYIAELSKKSLYVIVVGLGPRNHTPSRPDLVGVRKYFKGQWDEVDVIENLKIKGDSCPRDMYSVLFKSKQLSEFKTAEIAKKLVALSNRRANRQAKFFDAFGDFVNNIINTEGRSIEGTKYFDYLQTREPKRSRLSVGTARGRIAGDAKLISSIVNDGLRKPIGVPKVLTTQSATGKFDGYHRLAILLATGQAQFIGRNI